MLTFTELQSMGEGDGWTEHMLITLSCFSLGPSDLILNVTYIFNDDCYPDFSYYYVQNDFVKIEKM